MNCHCPPFANSTHVTLHYPDFDRFVGECSTATIDKFDTDFIIELTFEMSAAFVNEKTRMDSLRRLLSAYFDLGYAVNPNYSTDGVISFQNPLSVGIN